MEWSFNDGGRAESGYVGSAGDCVTRAISIATGKPYLEVYKELHARTREYAETKRDKYAKAMNRRGKSPRNGVYRKIYDQMLKDWGWKWVSCMTIGSGCTTHLKTGELPSGVVIARVSHHLCTVIDQVIQDTHNPAVGFDGINGSRCVYGYYVKENN